MKKGNVFIAIAFGAIFFLSFLWEGKGCYAQNVGINSTGAAPDNSAILNVAADGATKGGLLIPRVSLSSTTDATTIASPATSLLVYNTGTGGLSPAGYYYNAGTPGSSNWVKILITSSTSDAWFTLGNAGTVDGTNFIGTTDDVPLNFRVNNEKAGRIASNGTTFLGYQAGNVNTQSDNTGIGHQALYANTIGNRNNANGRSALYSNTIGDENTANGTGAFYSNTTGDENSG